MVGIVIPELAAPAAAEPGCKIHAKIMESLSYGTPRGEGPKHVFKHFVDAKRGHTRFDVDECSTWLRIEANN